MILQSLIASCVSVPDKPVCVEISLSKGWCTFTVSDKEFFIDDEHPYDFDDGQGPQTWWSIRPAMIQVPAQTWSAVKTFIIKVCKQSGKCDKDIDSWQRKAGSIDQQLKEKTP